MPSPPHARFAPLPTSIHTLVETTPNSILLETSRFDRANHHSYLFLDPVRILTAHTLDEIPALFADIERALGEGLHVAGYLSYECAGHFEPSTVRTDPTVGVPHSHAATSRVSGEARTPESTTLPLAHLAVYAGPITFDHATGTFLTPPPLRVPQVSLLRPGFPPIPSPTLRISDDAYTTAIEKIKAYISAGDTYQVNFTDAIQFPTNQSPAQLFTTLSQNQSVAYAAYLNLGLHQILSLSPELFFHLDGPTNKIITRPMKGTMPRGLDATEDAAAALALQHDEKNRAEHVMIVDLLRNDLGRLAVPGSVHVDELFAVERYQTLHQMTSTISATLRPRTSFYDLFAALFPCGSVTGAPKIRTMQIINELEAHPRGVYTGAIGFIAPDRSATFSVPIRTLVLEQGIATMGVGGGIVADSIPEDEHREALLKANFLTRTPQPFDLIETLLFDQHYQRLTLHLDRLESSAHYFDFLCDRTAAEAQLRAFAAFLDLRHPHRVRLLLSSNGNVSMTSEPLAESLPGSCFSFCHSLRESAVISPSRESTTTRVPHPYAASSWMGGGAKPPGDTLGVPHSYAPLRTGGNDAASQPTQPSPSAQDLTVTLSPHPTLSTDPFLRHKTTHRHLYNDELTRARAEGFDEVLFLNERNELTEGAVSNLFVQLPAEPGQAGRVLTPPLASGVLPGILRRHLLESDPDLEERTLTLADLQPPNTLWLGSSLRGLRKAKLRLEH